MDLCVRNGLSNQDEKQWLQLIQDNSIPEENFVQHLMEIHRGIDNKEFNDIHSPFSSVNNLTNIKSASELNDAFNAEELVGFINYLSQRPLSSKTIVFFREFGNVHAVQGALAEI